MLKSLFVALCYHMNHHPEENVNKKIIRKVEERLARRNKTKTGITCIHSKPLTPYLQTRS